MKFSALLRIALVLLPGAISLPAEEGAVSKADITIADMSTVLMQTTFRIDGPSKESSGKTRLGTVFIIGRPLKDNPQIKAYVLVTAAHVLNDIDGQVASLLVRRKNEEGTYSPYKWPITIRDKSGSPLFLQHKQADVAAMYVTLPSDLIQDFVSTNSFADDKAIEEYEIHPGDELMCVGFPYGLAVNNSGLPHTEKGSHFLVPSSSCQERKIHRVRL